MRWRCADACCSFVQLLRGLQSGSRNNVSAWRGRKNSDLSLAEAQRAWERKKKRCISTMFLHDLFVLLCFLSPRLTSELPPEPLQPPCVTNRSFSALKRIHYFLNRSMEREKDIADFISQSSVPPSAHSAARPISKPLQVRGKWMSGSRPALVLCRNKFQVGLEFFSRPGACPPNGHREVHAEAHADLRAGLFSSIRRQRRNSDGSVARKSVSGSPAGPTTSATAGEKRRRKAASPSVEDSALVLTSMAARRPRRWRT